MKHAGYDKFPEVRIKGCDDRAWCGWPAIQQVTEAHLPKGHKTVLVIDCYPGVPLDELYEQLISSLSPRSGSTPKTHVTTKRSCMISSLAT